MTCRKINMRWKRALLYQTALAAAMLLTAIYSGATRGNRGFAEYFPDTSDLLGIRGYLAQRAALADAQNLWLKHHLQSFEQMSRFGSRALQLFGGELTAARWLSNVSCSLAGPEPTKARPPKEPVQDFFANVNHNLQVEFGWSFDKVRMLPIMLGARWLWAEAPVLFSISPRSWSVLNAADLETLIYARAEGYLRRCIGRPSQWIPDGSREQLRHDAQIVYGILGAIAKNALGVGIEQLHIDLHDRGSPPAVNQNAEVFNTAPLRRALPNVAFSMFATSLLAAPLLQSVSISWDASQPSAKTLHFFKAIAKSLAHSASVRKLAMLRTCTSHVRGARFDPLAAFVRVAGAGRLWPAVEVLSVTVHCCMGEDLSCFFRPQALLTLTAYMPALRRVHFEYHCKNLYGDRMAALQDILPLVPPYVTVTIASEKTHFAGVARATSLARLGESVSDGYAVIMSVSDPIAVPEVPRPQMELIGRNVLQETTALTILPTIESSFERNQLQWVSNSYFHEIASHMPRLERLAVDCRWTHSYCNQYVARLPVGVGSRLRAIMVHTIVLWHDRPSAVFEALLGILLVGRDISTVELGIALPRDISHGDRALFRGLAFTLSQMPSLANVSLSVMSTSPIRDMRALGDLVCDILPRARVNLESSRWRFQYGDHDHRGLPISRWQFDRSASVLPTREFPSPPQFYGEF